MQQTGSPALREGLTFGILLGAILVIAGALSILVSASLGAIATIVTIVVSLACYIWAGVRASAKTGTVSTGLVAGLWTGVISSVINLIVIGILVVVDADTIRERAQQAVDAAHLNVTYSNSAVVGLQIGGLVLGLVIAALIGLGFGAIGGAIGKGRAPMAQLPYQEAMYQGIQVPAAGYPQYPQQVPPPYPPAAPYPPQYPPQGPQAPQPPQGPQQ